MCIEELAYLYLPQIVVRKDLPFGGGAQYLRIAGFYS